MRGRRLLIIGGALLLLGGVLLGVSAYLRAHPPETAETRVRAVLAEQGASDPAPEAAPQEDADTPYVSPVDFKDLQEMNPDIYAWLYVPGTNVNSPILQREGEDAFYLSHNSRGKPSKEGAIFTEETYTKKDFSDPVTVVYGHQTRSGEIFGNIQAAYAPPDGLEKHRKIVVYLPERELHYEAFAAVPFDMRHILYYNDFTDAEVFEAFLERVYSVRSINASIDKSVEVTADDQLLILSTCLLGDYQQRFLVLAKWTEEIPAP